MGNLVDYAKTELQRAGMFDDDSDYKGALAEAVVRMIEQFEAEEHSDMSANMAVNLFERLARFEPLTPLTGDDDEWIETSPGVFQNRRCSHVFKEGGQAYDIEGRIFRRPNGACFTSRDSRVPVTFPYRPKSEYVDVP